MDSGVMFVAWASGLVMLALVGIPVIVIVVALVRPVVRDARKEVQSWRRNSYTEHT